MTEEKELNSMDQSKFETDSQVCFCVIQIPHRDFNVFRYYRCISYLIPGME
jgi:hypothetical protein